MKMIRNNECRNNYSIRDKINKILVEFNERQVFFYIALIMMELIH